MWYGLEMWEVKAEKMIKNFQMMFQGCSQDGRVHTFIFVILLIWALNIRISKVIKIQINKHFEYAVS